MGELSPITLAKLALAIIGLITFGWGVRVDHEPLRWIGIAFLAGAFLLRFLPGGRTKRR